MFCKYYYLLFLKTILLMYQIQSNDRCFANITSSERVLILYRIETDSIQV